MKRTRSGCDDENTVERLSFFFIDNQIYECIKNKKFDKAIGRRYVLVYFQSYFVSNQFYRWKLSNSIDNLVIYEVEKKRGRDFQQRTLKLQSENKFHRKFLAYFSIKLGH